MEMSGSLASEIQYDLASAIEYKLPEFAEWKGVVGWTVDGAYCHQFSKDIYLSARADIWAGVVFFEVYVDTESVFQSKDFAEAGKRFIAELANAENENYS